MCGGESAHYKGHAEVARRVGAARLSRAPQTKHLGEHVLAVGRAHAQALARQ